MQNNDTEIWKCPICKVTYQVNKNPTHKWSKENHLVNCGLKNSEKKEYPNPENHNQYIRQGSNDSNIYSRVEQVKSWDLVKLQYLRWFLFGLIIFDMFFVYWYLELKAIGISLMLVIIVALSVTFILENRRRAMGDKEPKKIDLGLKDINKNLARGFT